MTHNRWNAPVERPELNSEHCRSERITGNLRSEPVRDCFIDNHHEQAYDYSKKGGHSETLLNTRIAHSNSAYLLLSNNASDWLSGDIDNKNQ